MRHDEAAQAAIFAEIFPGQAVPAGIRSRLESECTKMAGVKGESADWTAQRPAIALLFDLLASVPEGLRCRLLNVRLDRNRIQVEGELRSHSDADAITAGLCKRGLHVEPPRTQQLAGQGVSVRLAADSGDSKAQGTGDSL